MKMGFGTTVMVIMIMTFHCLDILLIDNDSNSIKCLQGTAHGNAENYIIISVFEELTV